MEKKEKKSESNDKVDDQLSRLPHDLVCSITKRLNLDDLIRFSCVCRSWHLLSSSLLPSKCSPWLIVPLDKDSRTKRNSTWNATLGFFSVYNQQIYMVETPQITDRRICGSCFGGWLITVHENGEIQLLHPFSKVVIDLPPITEIPGVIGWKKKNRNQYFVLTGSSFIENGIMQGIASDVVRESYISKTVMSTSDPTTAVVVCLQGYPKKLVFCKPGEDRSWSVVNGNDNADIADAIFYRGQFYATGVCGHVFVVEDLDSPYPFIKMVITPPSPRRSDKYYLVQSSGELLLVMRNRHELEDALDPIDEDHDGSLFSHTTTSFTISKLDFTGPKWVDVWDLGDDCSLFVGANQPFSLKTSDFPGCQGNCIYFTDDYVEHFKNEPFGGHDIGVFSLAGSVVEDCYPREVVIKPPPIWFTTHSH